MRMLHVVGSAEFTNQDDMGENSPQEILYHAERGSTIDSVI